MEHKMRFIRRRYPTASREQGSTHASNSRNSRVASTARDDHQQGEKRDSSQEGLQLPRMDMGYKQYDCIIGATATQGAEEGLYKMDEEIEKVKDCQDKRSGLVYRAAKRHSLCVQGRLNVHGRIFQNPQQASSKRWMGQFLSSKLQYKEGNGGLDKKAECPIFQTPNGILSSRRSPYDRRFAPRLRSHTISWRRNISFFQSIFNERSTPNLKLQGTPGCFIGTQQIFLIDSEKSREQISSQIGQHMCCLQRQQMECLPESPSTPQENTIVMSSNEPHSHSVTHPRGEEYGSRRIVKVGNRRRLLDPDSSSSTSRDSSWSSNRDRRFRKRHKQKEGDLVWARKQASTGRPSSKLGKRNSSHSSPYSTDSSMSSESRIGKSESDLSSSGLEESDLEQPSFETDDSLLHLEMLSRRPFPRTGNVEVGSRTSSRGVYGCKDRMVARVGERWWSEGLRACGVPDKIRKITEESISKVTWNQYINCFAHFHIEWKSNQLGEIPGCFDEWIKKCAVCFLSLKDRGTPYSSLCAMRSAISLFSRTVYGREIGDIPLIHTIFRSFSFSQSHKKPYTSMWSPDIITGFYSRELNNEQLPFLDLTVKCILLIMLFSACRFCELARISMSESIWETEAIHLSTRLKTSRSREFITVPFLQEEHIRICPARAIRCLWDRVRTTYEKRDTFLLNKTTHTPLTPSGIRKLAKFGMMRAGVPEEFRPYTIKHATISKLSTEGIPETCVARFARLSTTAHTPLKSYFKTNLASQMAHMLLPQSPELQLSDENFRKEKVQRLQSKNISIGTMQQTTTITFGKQFEQSSDISAEA
ncbi:uncharacterized protein MONOS_6360 [Monocercomonoides exilis]|uniref:uncharacterized protein n=1 Tax=Monocercomonoides exilis TaxID=2049356 RepID=UPI0035597E78|nr:hypothetical protein MONOS_6360 [Monocercomonoides exilis]|eukprot:MONOS_6360.1-p1 / transcript=MONOS_6360.1 / gene=MONOS_6360 / organism=Monocercomonoides_exilis_PA203 / gene_product=unspecified product / transcript_product=unspecified product / location=Mono_scaffold00199:49996-52443(-) / protein_length=815 / sequence_SO=supercontig / SO=protein_coding / is_pseudo=false